MRTNTPNLDQRPFALVFSELLAVVAVIGCLATLLVPATDRIRAKVAQNRAVANLRQIGSAYLAFAQDNKSRIPALGASRREGGVHYHFSWDYFILPYMGIDAGWRTTRNTQETIDAYGATLEKLFWHDRDRFVVGGDNPAVARRTFAMNIGVGGDTFVSSMNDFPELASFPTPERLVLASERPKADGDASKVGARPFAEISAARQLAAGMGENMNPGGKFDYLFLDGHVRAMAWEETVPPSVSVGGRTGTGARNLWAP